MPLREDDPQSQLRIAAFTQVLRQIGWVEGQTKSDIRMVIPNGYSLWLPILEEPISM